ncbi:aminotransferase class I/II-fold pyridoxal phosphate-dependent enzyme [Blastococcus sp. Marseille-P5729]|uniref:aminotransferase class I/II-fold pyridoxal phosphate-dependent enzyme n=1 Tax=Blastococcus sp. Marseille-P5729 TaxID=2086582 RepID=UPI000D1145B1|nr:aminotransferase class I/II-fold pyridoxal phosphate-dependent enzyme [Blastococcus sp. Marseille-P5729]
MSRLSTRSETPPFHVMDVLSSVAVRQQTHGDVVLLCVGQPSTGAPARARELAEEAVRSQVLGYTETAGNLELRQAIAQHYDDWYGVPVAPEQVLLTTGSSAGFTALFLAAFDVGDQVVVTRPGYPAYRNTLHSLGCQVVDLDCGPDTRFQPTVDLLDALPEKPAGLVLASPANPAGTILADPDLAAIAQWCEANDCLLISDEIYHGIIYGTSAQTAWKSSREAAVVGSFSKYFSMTGWRLGWTLLPDHLLRPVEALLGNLNLCPPAISQAAALGVFSDSARAELASHVARYARNREVLLSRLPGIGVHDATAPDGAFYAYVDISHLTDDSLAWCQQVLAATGVAIAPGIDFAPDGVGAPELDGSRFVRFSFAGSEADIVEGFDRLSAYVAH